MARGRGYVQNAQTRLNRARARSQGRGRGRGPSAAPWDSTAQRESAELRNEGADTRASLAAKFAAAQNQLGFGSGASNPYSQAAENKTNLTNEQRGVTNAAGNQLYAGSTANAQSAARSQYDKTQKGLEDSYAEAQNADTRGQAQSVRDEQLGQAAIREGAIERRAATAPPPLGVRAGGRGRIRERQNVRRPARARALNAQARQINAQANRGRGRI
jgi:hypothetical protein